jgi:hypothetical protein
MDHDDISEQWATQLLAEVAARLHTYLTMPILHNAIASIKLGIDDYRSVGENNARMLSAIRNLTAGLVLMFKYKLQKLSPDGSDEVLLKTRVTPTIDPRTGALVWLGKGRGRSILTTSLNDWNHLESMALNGRDSGIFEIFAIQ